MHSIGHAYTYTVLYSIVATRIHYTHSTHIERHYTHTHTHSIIHTPTYTHSILV